MDLTNEVYNSVNNYFSALSHLGYKSDGEVNQLLIFSFIEELLYGPLAEFITEDDYRDINNSLYCLYGSCLIPFPDYKKGISFVTNNVLDKYRNTEIVDLINTE